VHERLSNPAHWIVCRIGSTFRARTCPPASFDERTHVYPSNSRAWIVWFSAAKDADIVAMSERMVMSFIFCGCVTCFCLCIDDVLNVRLLTDGE
jgi:hypothetical protein